MAHRKSAVAQKAHAANVRVGKQRAALRDMGYRLVPKPIVWPHPPEIGVPEGYIAVRELSENLPPRKKAERKHRVLAGADYLLEKSRRKYLAKFKGNDAVEFRAALIPLTRKERKAQ